MTIGGATVGAVAEGTAEVVGMDAIHSCTIAGELAVTIGKVGRRQGTFPEGTVMRFK